MKNLYVSEPPIGGSPVSRFASARSLAFNFAESDQKFIEPELIEWTSKLT